MRNLFQRIKNAIPHKFKDAGVGAAENAAALAGKAQELGSGALDALTRKSTDDAVREHILQQGRYNDILAIKLDEALKRIDALEKKLESK